MVLHCSRIGIVCYSCFFLPLMIHTVAIWELLNGCLCHREKEHNSFTLHAQKLCMSGRAAKKATLKETKKLCPFAHWIIIASFFVVLLTLFLPGTLTLVMNTYTCTHPNDVCWTWSSTWADLQRFSHTQKVPIRLYAVTCTSNQCCSALLMEWTLYTHTRWI